MKHVNQLPKITKLLLILTVTASVYAGCKSSAAEGFAAPPPPQLPVYAVTTAPANTHQEFAASIEGKVNVEIRPQVDGYLDKIYVEEGAYVKAGQPLFRINGLPYREQLTNARASLLAAQANMQKASVEVDRLKPLVEASVIADVQLKTAQAAYEAAKAQVEQAKSVVANAQINLGYTTIEAPASGYIGRIPYKAGSLVGRGEGQALTVLSDVSEVYAYFSMSEIDFISFSNQFKGTTIEDKLKQVPAVELRLPDNSIYAQKGTIQNVDGQFDKTMGAITFRAKFPNTGRILRTGNTGKVRLSHMSKSSLLVPQDATYEIQDKVFVFALNDSNQVVGKPITISGKTAQYYFVESGIKEGEKILLSGIGNMRDGMKIVPQIITADSLQKMKPL